MNLCTSWASWAEAKQCPVEHAVGNILCLANIHVQLVRSIGTHLTDKHKTNWFVPEGIGILQ